MVGHSGNDDPERICHLSSTEGAHSIFVDVGNNLYNRRTSVQADDYSLELLFLEFSASLPVSSLLPSSSTHSLILKALVPTAPMLTLGREGGLPTDLPSQPLWHGLGCWLWEKPICDDKLRVLDEQATVLRALGKTPNQHSNVVL